jgi:LysR family transcriptional regulator, low CO2-responsive transcriptional regulator
MATDLKGSLAMPLANIRRLLKHGTLSQLRVFEASARLGSFTRAAQELNMAQPTASVQIKKLAETIGHPLFEQVGRHIYLTEAGKRVYAGCNDVFRALSRLEEALDEMRGMASGHLQLAVTSTAKYFAPRLLGAFMQLYPGIDTSLQIHNRSTLIERLGNNEDDLYMFADPPEEQEVVVQSILSDPLVVVARSDHALAREKGIRFSRLAEEPFLMREPGSGTRRITIKLFERHGLVPKVRMELNTNEAIGEAVLAGLGVSILSRHSLGHEPDHVKLICLDVEGFPVERHWHFVYPVGKQLSVAARAFMDFARLEAKSLDRDAFAQRLL